MTFAMHPEAKLPRAHGAKIRAPVDRCGQPDTHSTRLPLTNPQAPPPVQIVEGRQVQVTVPEHAAGTSVQNGAGGVQGGSSHPGPEPPDTPHWVL
jgi:hypothetical protein